MSANKVVATYPGTFDPITKGHIDLARRASSIFDKIVIAIAENSLKKTLFTIDERLEMVKEALGHIDNIEVVSYNTLLVDLMQKKGSKVAVRGIRALSDYEYEFQMSFLNHSLYKDYEAIFLLPSIEYLAISSTFVKDIARNKGELSSFVTDDVLKKLQDKFSQLSTK